MSNYHEFIAALQDQRQHELRVQAAQGLNQKHGLKPDTRLVPMPDNIVQPFAQEPDWISQVDHHLFTPELHREILREEYKNRVHHSLFGQPQRITKHQLITKRAMRRLNHQDR